MVEYMKAALLYGPMDVRVIDVPKPTIEPNEVLIKVKLCLTAGTSVKKYVRGYPGKKYPFGFGYEWAGEVEAVGEGVDTALRGKRCRITWNRTCTCFFCVRGQPNLCVQRDYKQSVKADDPESGRISGMFREYVKAPVSNVDVFPDHLSSEDACMIPTMTVVQHGNNNVCIKIGDSVAVVGAGVIGQLHMLLSHLRGAQTIAIDMVQSRLDFAKKIGAADYIINAKNQEDAKAQLDDLNINHGYGPDVVIEAVGLPQTWEEAFALVRRGGQVLLYGGCPPGTSINIDTYKLHYDEITLVSSTTASPIDGVRAYNLIERGMVKPSVFISGRYPLANIRDALEAHRTQKGLKFAVIP